MRLHAALAVIPLLFLCAAPRLAGADGRSPATMSVDLRAGAPEQLLVGTTFGALISRDGGGSFRWLCEQVVGYANGPDPKWRWLADGTLVATTQDGVSLSTDGGCTFTRAAGTEGVQAADVEVAPSDPRTLYTITIDSAQASKLLRSTDGGHSFPDELLASPAGRYLSSIAVSGSHIYVRTLSLTDRQSWVIHSPDAGKTWDEFPFSYPAHFAYTLAAADQASPETIYVIANEPSALLRSTDAGKTFAPLHMGAGPLLSFAATESSLYVYDTRAGLLRSDHDGTKFEPVPAAPRASCLTPRGEVLVSCANYQLDRYVLAEIGAAVTPVLTWFDQIPGPIECATGTPSRTICDGLWPALAQQFSFSTPDAGVPDAAAPPPKESSGCATGGSSGGALGVALILLATRSLRRRS